MGLQWNVNLEFRFVLVKLIGVTVTYGRGRREHQRTNLDEAHSGTPGNCFIQNSPDFLGAGARALPPPHQRLQ
jgi:hypothetical protein